ncbi:hypothetical protein [Priestia megaterium]|uniref:hypothetical protein n=1 Tax=Priestia megaterium TaxID=1404 RepID=UPI003CC54796
MNIREFFKMYTEIKDNSNGRLEIGELLDKLNQFNDDDKIEFSNGKYFEGHYGSYRGYYSDLYLEFCEEDKGFNTVGFIKEALHDALSNGTMQGYKGGDFPIDENTFTWFAEYGRGEGYEIIDVRKIDGIIFVIVDKE